MDVAVALTALALIVPVELPDKTFVATLVLSTKFRPWLVWVGVGLAFAVQTAIAVTLGGLLARLPQTPVAVVAALLFAAGAVYLWRSASHAEEEEAEAEEEFGAKVTAGATGLRAVGTSFLVLFLAEWGDLSQLLTAGLAARSGDPLSVFVGAWTALLLVSGLGALLGRWLLTWVRLATVRRIGGTVCGVLAVLTALQAAGVDLPV
jgi:putative Ca2+/H+ antiporter (TMEM165/GDT1 family)